MKDWKIDIPVVLFFFNREDTTREVFEQIRKVRPRQFFMISDGARPDKEGEKEKVEKLKKLSNEVDWDCQLFTEYSEYNMGCDRRIISGLNMVFEHVDRVVILEDDCFPTLQYFDFCEEMLETYKDQKNISYIAGGTYVKTKKREYGYYFANFGSTWGWATWKDRWCDYMVTPEEAEKKMDKCFKGVFSDKRQEIWLKSARRHFSEADFPWDFLWQIGTSGTLRIVPNVNLVINIGFNKDSTHTQMKPNGYYGKLGKINKPYTCPDEISADVEYIKEYERKTKNRIWNKLIAKTIMLIHSIREK